MAPGLGSLVNTNPVVRIKPESLPADYEVHLLRLFDLLLKIFRGHAKLKEAPSFFVVYAWDIGDEHHPAESDVVHDFIQWFQDAGYEHMFSDRSGAPALSVLDGQEKLLPYHAFRPWTVERVLLCGSKLLGKYLAAPEYDGYAQDVLAEYETAREKAKSQEPSTLNTDEFREMFPRLRAVQSNAKECMRADNFHHVLTEMALLKLRNHVEASNSVIPLLLNGEKDCFPSHILNGNNALRESLEAWGSKHMCFLNILQKLVNPTGRETREGRLIREMASIYGESRKAADQMGELDCSKLNQLVDKSILACYDKLHRWLDELKETKNGVDINDILRDLNDYHDSLWKFKGITGDDIKVQDYPNQLVRGTEVMPLNSLFTEEHLLGSKSDERRHIHIRDRPGVGKSTLCRQILYEYGRRDVLGEPRFFWVLWIKLRALEHATDVETYFSNEHFSCQVQKEDKSKKLWESIRGKDTSKTLLILDGWDETAGWQGRQRNVLNQLLKFRKVIITSRSATEGSDHVTSVSVDLEAEAIGFNETTIRNRVESHTNLHEQEKRDIQLFISQSPRNLDFLRTPIHLDILCISWARLRLNPDSPVPTITSLYQAIEIQLWRRDIPVLRKEIRGRPIDEGIVRNLRTYQRLTQIVKDEISILSELAYSLTKSYRTTFTENDVAIVISQREKKGSLPWDLEQNLTRLSFLRADGPPYSFIHLTFQEYFTACRLLQHPSELRDDIAEFKYNPRFSMVWRFLAGMISASGEEGQLCEYYQNLEAKPRDVLGPSHQRLIVRCLGESSRAIGPTFRSICTGLDMSLTQWVLFIASSKWDGAYSAKCAIIREEEISVGVIESALNKASDSQRACILQARRGSGYTISSEIVGLVLSWLKSGLHLSPLLESEIFCLLESSSQATQQSSMDIMVAYMERTHHTLLFFDAPSFELLYSCQFRQSVADYLLGSRHEEMFLDLFGKLRSHRAKMDFFIDFILPRLADSDQGVASAALRLISVWTDCEPVLPEYAITGYVIPQFERLGSTESGSESLCILMRILKRHPVLPSESLPFLTRYLYHESSEVCLLCFEVLQRVPALPDDAVSRVLRNLFSRCESLQGVQFPDTTRPSNLKSEVVEALAEQLCQRNGTFYGAAMVLRHQTALGTPVLKIMIDRLAVADQSLCKYGYPSEAHTCCGWLEFELWDRIRRLTEESLEQLTSQLVRGSDSTVSILMNHSTRPRSILRMLRTLIADPRQEHVRIFEDYWDHPFGTCSQALPDLDLRVVAAQLDHIDDGVRWQAFQILLEQNDKFLETRTSFPDSALKVIIRFLDHPAHDIVERAAQLLMQQFQLSNDVLLGFIKKLLHDLPALSHTNALALPIDAVDSIFGKLADPRLMWAALLVLQRQQSLRVGILGELSRHLPTSGWPCAHALGQAISCRTGTTQDELELILNQLKNPNTEIVASTLVLLASVEWDLPTYAFAEVIEQLPLLKNAVRLTSGYVRSLLMKGAPFADSSLELLSTSALWNVFGLDLFVIFEILENELSLSENILRTLCETVQGSRSCESTDIGDVPPVLLSLLFKQPTLPSAILDEYLDVIFLPAFGMSFQQDLSWVVAPSFMRIESSYGTCHVTGTEEELQKFCKKLLDKVDALGIPPRADLRKL